MSPVTLEWGRVQLVLKHITHNDNDGYIYGGNMTVRDSKSGERGEHVRAIFLPLLC